MQEVCKTKLGWDQSLEGKLLNKWNHFVNDLKTSQPVVLSRSYFCGTRGETTNYRLYGFCDASITAYAAVVYLVEETDGRKRSSFVASKTRVAPLKTLTIPRLELLSAVLLARLISNTTDSLSTRIDLMEPKCFTDSQVALFWIKGTGKDWKPFVQNRVNEVRKLVPVECWDHCLGKENPADIPSRGLTPLELSVNQMWKNGPEWLKTSINVTPLPEEIPELCVAELKTASQGVVHSLLTTQPPRIGQLIDIQRFSSVHKLYRATAYVLRFVKLLRRRVKSPEITQADLSEAERLWVLDAQSCMVQDQNFPMWKIQFGLFQDESQIWRCGGRLQHANLSFSSKHPVILSKKSTLTALIAHSAHRRVQHNGVKETLTEIQAKYWVIGGRSLLRSIIHKCVICRRFEGRPFTAPPAPPLPSFRVNKAPPFSYTALDFAGPMYLKCKGESSSNKVWICLFTCCVTRAIHLELVPDMTTTTFIRCLKRFSARRGLPRRIISDNAKTFKAAARLIKTIFNHKEVKDYLSDVGVEWTFNLEKAPWWGGLFERMVKSTKRCLRKMIGQAKFSYDEMHTAIVEIEAIINSRPLTFLNSDDTEEPLTPSHLLVGRRILSLPDNLAHFAHEDEDFEVTGESLQRRAKHLNSVLNHFWKRWSKEYLLELRNAHRQLSISRTSAPVKIGDIVLVHDPDRPRGFWKVARVEKLITGRDGLVRGAALKLPSKNGQQTTLQRPLQLIYPLEVTQSECHLVNESDESNAPLQETPPGNDPNEGDRVDPHSRPQRPSASRAQDRIKEWSRELLEDTSDYEHS